MENKNRWHRGMVVIFLFLTFSMTNGQIPKKINYQGVLKEVGGVPVPDGIYSITFKIYDQATGGDALWSEIREVSVNNGLFDVILGTQVPLDLAFDKPYWLGIAVGGGNELLPRTPLTAVPYSLSSGSVTNGAITKEKLAASGGTAGQVLSTDGTNLQWVTPSTTGEYWSLYGNAGTDTSQHFIGTRDQQPFNIRVGNQCVLRIEPSAQTPNIIGGYQGNRVMAGVHAATIGGGGKSGDLTNIVTDHFGTIGGGGGNQVGNNDDRIDNCNGATVAGGFLNKATAKSSFIGGGVNNSVSGNWAAIVGGNQNSATAIGAFIGGGGTDGNINKGNNATGVASVIGGGVANTASGGHATIGGGIYNEVTAPWDATIGGGYGNIASGQASTVPGGVEAHARVFGQFAYSSGKFATTGDAQTSFYVLRRTSTGSNLTNLYLNGRDAAITVPTGRTIAFEILVVGRSNDNKSAAYRFYGMIANPSSYAAFAFHKDVVSEDDTAWDAEPYHGRDDNSLQIRVRGNGQTIRWVAIVWTAEVAW